MNNLTTLHTGTDSPPPANPNGPARVRGEGPGGPPGPLRRTVAQPCEKYFVKVAALHERIRAMRTEDMTMRAIAEREGVSTRAVHYAIHKNDPPRTPDTPQAPKTDASADA